MVTISFIFIFSHKNDKTYFSIEFPLSLFTQANT
jgi:hypothetical protein